MTPLLFEHITNENREVGVTLGKAELASNVGTLVIVSWLTRVGLDVLTLKTNCVQTADVYLLVGQAALFESGDKLGIVTLDS